MTSPISEIGTSFFFRDTRGYYVTINTIGIYYQIYGDVANPVVLFIHGYSSYPCQYKTIISSLSTKYCVVCPHLIGHGISGDFRGNLSVDEQSDMISQLATMLKLTDVTIVGHSVGGLIAYRLLDTECKKWIKKVILISPFFSPGKHITQLSRHNMFKYPAFITYLADLFVKVVNPRNLVTSIILDFNGCIHNPNNIAISLADPLICKTTPLFSVFNASKNQNQALSQQIAQIPVSIFQGDADMLADHSGSKHVGGKSCSKSIDICHKDFEQALLQEIHDASLSTFHTIINGSHQFYDDLPVTGAAV
jgi:alpha-beta hydrolase superfamily lysophospholipase